MLEVLSGEDPESYWAPPGPRLSGLGSASAAIREGGGQPVTTGWGGGHQTLHFIFGPTQAIPLEKPGLKNGKGYMVEYLFSARVKDRGIFFRNDFYGRKSDVSLVESSSRKRVGLRGIVGSTRLMAWVVRERGGRGEQSLRLRWDINTPPPHSAEHPFSAQAHPNIIWLHSEIIRKMHKIKILIFSVHFTLKLIWYEVAHEQTYGGTLL